MESIKNWVLVGRRMRKPDASPKNARSFNPGSQLKCGLSTHFFMLSGKPWLKRGGNRRAKVGICDAILPLVDTSIG